MYRLSLPNGAKGLNLWGSLTSKLDGYPIDLDPSPAGAKPVHEENCFGIKLHLWCIKYKWQFEIKYYEDYHVAYPTALFYARRAILREAIFVSDRLDTLGVGLKLRDSLRACSEGYPVTSDSRLHRELKPADDHFLFLYLALPIKLNLQGLSGVPKLHRLQCILTPTMRHSKQRNSFTKRNHQKQAVLRRK
jgi:hypothetical protein